MRVGFCGSFLSGVKFGRGVQWPAAGRWYIEWRAGVVPSSVGRGEGHEGPDAGLLSVGVDCGMMGRAAGAGGGVRRWCLDARD